MRKIMFALTALVVMSLAVPASAYTLPTAETTGFVGKGEVQTVFGLNNAGMQAVHQSVVFQYESSVTYQFDCEWWTGPVQNRKRHEVTEETIVAVNAAVASDSRKTGQWTGWTLAATNFTGASGPTNADCGAEGNDMKSIVAGTVEAVSTTGGLYATIGGVRRLIP